MPAQSNAERSIGIVVIGRNEGERLRRCLESVAGRAGALVYVDSGSTDGSRELAQAMGAALVDLDLSAPFTAARARNAGFEELARRAPDVEFVQFVDGDCELHPDWLARAARTIAEHDDLAVVCGRRRERNPWASVYNQLCDIEWDTPIGPARACGGDALVRARAFRAVGGFDASMIAGEEPELCLRLSRAGFWIYRQDAEMTLHDAAMTRWTQWWQRAVRCGHTTAELLAKHGRAQEHGRLRRALSALAWAVLLPAMALGFALSALWQGDFGLLALVALATAGAYAVLLARVRQGCMRRGRSRRDANAYAVSCALAKWPEAWGMALYAWRRVRGRRAAWIEYKDPPREVAARSSRSMSPIAVEDEGFLSRST